MYGLTFALISVFLANSCSNEEKHFDTSIYECKDLCCSNNKCVSFDVVVSSLECHLNMENSISGDVQGIQTDINVTRTNREEQLVLHASCTDWEEGSNGCKIDLKLKKIWKTSFEKNNVKQKSGPATNGAPLTLQTPPACPATFTQDEETASCWKIISSREPRNKAEKSCAHFAPGGRLAVLDTINKYLYVRRLLVKSKAKHCTCVHIGGTRSKSGKFIWMNKADVGKHGWCTGQPSGKRTEKLLSLWPESNYCFDDIKYSDYCDYVCEVKQ